MFAIKIMAGNYYLSVAIIRAWQFRGYWFKPYSAAAGLTLGFINVRMGDARDL